MVGELSTSHEYIGGGDMGPAALPASSIYTGRLGADLAADAQAGHYRFQKIYGPTEYNLDVHGPLARPDIDLREGDFLLAINGRELKVGDDYFQ